MELNKSPQRNKHRKHRAYIHTWVIRPTRHRKRAKQNYKLKDYKTRNTNRKYITSMTGHMPIKQENTDLLYFNTLFITKSYIAEVYTVQRTVFHTSLYLQNTLLYIKELKGKWLQPPQASNKARILYRQYRDAFERAIHTLKKSVMTQKTLAWK